jgi:hypothetical protein
MVGLVAGLALLGALIALQLVDDGNDGRGTVAVEVKGAAASRASLNGTVTGATGWSVEITVTEGADRHTTVAAPDGTYRIRDLIAGEAEVRWVAESTGDDGPSAEGLRVDGGKIVGRTPLTLAPGANTFDLAL